MRIRSAWYLAAFVIAIGLAVAGGFARHAGTPVPEPTSSPEMESPSPTPVVLTKPVPGFRERVTLKPFGIYITPETSPVEPERFTGYHTGADAEFTDTDDDVPVSAIADGAVVFAGRVNGYGGVIVIRHEIQDGSANVLYGHLDESSFAAGEGEAVSAGQQLAVLGEGFTDETDGERKHLHLSVSLSSSIDYRGYVQSESELDAWLNPLDLFEYPADR